MTHPIGGIDCRQRSRYALQAGQARSAPRQPRRCRAARPQNPGNFFFLTFEDAGHFCQQTVDRMRVEQDDTGVFGSVSQGVR
jgi:hypothetical protein